MRIWDFNKKTTGKHSRKKINELGFVMLIWSLKIISTIERTFVFV